jgi:large subunit ribosomal protein L14
LKESILVPADKCGVETVKLFHLYTGFNRKFSKIGNFVKCSVKKTAPNNFIKKKSKLKGLIIRTRYFFKNNDNLVFSFKDNNIILLKKRLTPRGKEVIGPGVRLIKRKKFLNSLAGII